MEDLPYKVAYGSTIIILEQKINELFNKGYEPYGGLVEGQYGLYQAMVKS